MSPACVSTRKVRRVVTRRLSEGYTYADLAYWIWGASRTHACMDYGRYNCGDGERLKRRLGVITYIYRGKPHRQKLLHYKTAVEIIEGIGCDPVDAGL